MDWAKFAVFQIVVSSSQLAGACANELADVDSDALNANRTWFSGGSGMIVEGRVKPRTVTWALSGWSGVALIGSFVLAFLMDTGVLSLLLMTLGLFLALSYSVGPMRFSYRGLGEVVMAFMVSFLTPLVSFYILFGTLHELIVWAALPIVFQMLGLMMVVEYPDRAADLASGKRNLVVRFGSTRSWRLGILMLVIGGAIALYSVRLGLPIWAGVAPGAVLFAEALVFWALGRVPDSKSKNFWSTAISCGFFVLVILVIAATLYRA